MIIMKQDDDDVVACDVTIPQFASSSRTIGYYVQYASVHQQQGMKKNRTASYICVNAAAAKSTWSRKNYDSRLLALNSELGQIVLLFFFISSALSPCTAMYSYNVDEHFVMKFRVESTYVRTFIRIRIQFN